MSLLRTLSKYSKIASKQNTRDQMFRLAFATGRNKLGLRNRRKLDAFVGRHGKMMGSVGNWAWRASGAANVPFLDAMKNWGVDNFQKTRATQINNGDVMGVNDPRNKFTKSEKNEIAHNRAMMSANKKISKSEKAEGGGLPQKTIEDIRIIRELTEKNIQQGSGILGGIMSMLGTKGFGGLLKGLGGLKGAIGGLTKGALMAKGAGFLAKGKGLIKGGLAAVGKVASKVPGAVAVAGMAAKAKSSLFTKVAGEGAEVAAKNVDTIAKLGTTGAAAAAKAAPKSGGLIAKGLKGVAGIAKSGKGILGKVGTKIAGTGLAKGAMKMLPKGAGKILAKGGGKMLGKKLPLVGAGLGLLFGAQRALGGDFKGAGLEIASGLLGGFVPGFGTAASLGIDGMLIARDIQKAKEAGQEVPPELQEAASEIEKQQGNTQGAITPENAPKGQNQPTTDIKKDEQKQSGLFNTLFGKTEKKDISKDAPNGTWDELITAALDRKKGIFVTLSSDNEALAEALANAAAGGGNFAKAPETPNFDSYPPESVGSTNTTIPVSHQTRMSGTERTYNRSARGEKSRATPRTDNTPLAPVPDIKGWQLGQTSKRYESGRGGAGTVSSGRGDYGGVSYGTYQFASRNGSVQKFLKDNPEYGKQFAGLAPGSAAFSAKWKEIAKNDQNFGKVQHDYIKKTHYDPQMRYLQKAGIKLDKRGAAVHDAVWSTSVQMGAGTGVIKKALAGKNVEKMSDADIISAIQDYKHANTGSMFRSSSDAVRASVAKRALDEKKSLLALDKAVQSQKFDMHSNQPKVAKAIKESSNAVDMAKADNQQPMVVPVPMPNAAPTGKAGRSGPDTYGGGSHMLTRNTDTSIRRLTDAKMSYSMV